MHESTQKDTSFAISDLDPERMYTAASQPETRFGSCVTSKVVLGNEKASSGLHRGPPAGTTGCPPSVDEAHQVVRLRPCHQLPHRLQAPVRQGYTWKEFDPDRKSAAFEQLDPTVNWDFVMRTVNGRAPGC